MENCEMEKHYACKNCNEIFQTKHFLSFHMRKVHHDIPAYECNICHKSFRLSIHLEIHKEICKTSEPGESTPSVTDSEEVESSLSEICSESESKTTNGKKKLIHKKRPQNIKKRSKVKKHQKNEKEVGEVMIEIFKKPDHMRGRKEGLKRLSPGEDIKYTPETVDGKIYQRCSCCKKLVHNDAKSSEAHMNRHLDIKPHVCKHCNKSFTALEALVRHTRVHTDEKPYACKYCPDRFRNSQTKNVHERAHIAFSWYQCQNCKQKFVRSTTMYQHIIRKHIL